MMKISYLNVYNQQNSYARSRRCERNRPQLCSDKGFSHRQPHIIEICQLEMDVGKLKILHASHLSQKYSLEDKILKEYPQEIKRLTERIAGYKTDIDTVAKHRQTKTIGAVAKP